MSNRFSFFSIISVLLFAGCVGEVEETASTSSAVDTSSSAFSSAIKSSANAVSSSSQQVSSLSVSVASSMENSASEDQESSVATTSSSSSAVKNSSSMMVSSSSQASSSAPAIRWKACVSSPDTCYFEGRSKVRFGSPAKWITKTATDSIACKVSSFGEDPLPGEKKACQVPDSTKIKQPPKPDPEPEPKPDPGAGEFQPVKKLDVLFAKQLVKESHVSDGRDYFFRKNQPEFDGPLGANAVTYNGYQYAVFYTGKNRSNKNSVAKVRIARRQLAGGSWEYATLKNYSLKSENTHNRPIIGISKGDGRIHIAFDHHATTHFNYAQTKVGIADSPESVTWNDNVFTYTKDAGFKNKPFNSALTRLTYPVFSSLPSGNLIMYFRGGSSNSGAMNLAKYDATDHKWKFVKSFSTSTGKFKGGNTTRSPYTSRGIQITPEGNLQVSWVWREKLGTEGCDGKSRDFKKCTNGLFFAKSANEGTTWQNNAGKMVANVNTNAKIKIDNIGGPVVNVPGSLEPTNVGNTSAIDPVTGDMHIMLSHKKKKGDKSPVIHHYIGTEKGKWSGKASTFKANGAEIRFVGDYALAFTDRSRAQVFAAKRSEKFQTWREITMPSLNVGGGKSQKPQGGFITWDTSRLATAGVATILWHFKTSNEAKGAPSPIWTYDLQVLEK